MICKKPIKINQFIKEEASKRYHAPAIKEAMLDHFNEKQMGAEFLQLESVLNAQHKVRGGLNAPFIGSGDFIEDLKESLEWLTVKKYQVEWFETPDYQGFAFATEEILMHFENQDILQSWILLTKPTSMIGSSIVLI